MFGRRLFKEIEGNVYFDSGEYDCSKDSNFKSVNGAGIRLYRLVKVNDRTRQYTDLNIYEKHLVFQTKTNKNGLFRFYAAEGRYTVELDPGSLPKGKGVTENNIFVDFGNRKNIAFCVKDIYSIEIEDLGKELYLGDFIDLNPVLKDKYGQKLFADAHIISDDREIELNRNRLRVNKKVYDNRKVELDIKIGEISRHVSLNFKVPEINSIQKARLAYDNGIIDEGAKILSYLYSLYDLKRLDSIYKSNVPLKSGTTAVKEIHDYIRNEHADKNIVSTAERYLLFAVPKLDKTYSTKSGFFNIHYTTAGKDAVSLVDNNRNGVPDYIEFIGMCFEQVKEVTCGVRGFNIPLLEKDKMSLDINVFNLDGKYGLTYPLTFFDGEHYKKKRAFCCICLDNNYSTDKGFKKGRDECVKVTAAHEFFHAVQYAYNVDAESWWKEASATWNEDEVYDGVNDYFQYLDSVFSSPEKSLEKNSYGGVVFAKYLSENYGYEMIKRIWELHGSKFDSSMDSINSAIREKYPNESLEAVFDRYTACNYSPSQYYREGNLWSKKVYIKSAYSSYPVSNQEGQLNHLASNYLLFKPLPAEKDKNLRISVAAGEKAKLGFKIQRRRTGDNLCEIVEIGKNKLMGGTEIICQSFGDNYSEVCFIPASLERERDGTSYSFSASLM